MRTRSLGSGTTRPTKSDVRILETGDQFTVKGKTVPRDLDGIDDSPRKELAAWKIQTLFLDPADYTVPATALRCIPHERQSESTDTPNSTLPGTKCLLGAASIWIQHVAPTDELYEEERFLDDVSYAYHLANLNIFAYLIDPRDNRRGNVLVSKDEDNHRVFAVDNDVAFGTIRYNWCYPPTYAWRTNRVPALPRNSIDRLRELRREDLDFLMVVAQMQVDSDGVLRTVDPGPPIDPEEGANFDGTTLQFGLTADEIALF